MQDTLKWKCFTDTKYIIRKVFTDLKFKFLSNDIDNVHIWFLVSVLSRMF